MWLKVYTIKFGITFLWPVSEKLKHQAKTAIFLLQKTITVNRTHKPCINYKDMNQTYHGVICVPFVIVIVVLCAVTVLSIFSLTHFNTWNPIYLTTFHAFQDTKPEVSRGHKKRIKPTGPQTLPFRGSYALMKGGQNHLFSTLATLTACTTSKSPTSGGSRSPTPHPSLAPVFNHAKSK